MLKTDSPAVIRVPTHLGNLIFERYPDGDVLASLGGEHWAGVSAIDASAIARFLTGNKAQPSVNVANIRTSVRKEDTGWVASLPTGEQYIYRTRDQARTAKVSDPIGENGRTA